MAIAFVLISCDLGYEKQIIHEIKQLEDVKEAHEVFGAYDILAKVESANEKNLRETITWKIRRLDKVRSTLTLMTIKDQE